MAESEELQKIKDTAERMIRDYRGDSIIESPARLILILIDIIERQEKINEVLRARLKVLRHKRQI